MLTAFDSYEKKLRVECSRCLPAVNPNMLYHVKSEAVPLSRQLTRSAVIFALTFLGSLLIHRLWSTKSNWESWRTLFDSLVAAGIFFVLDSGRREYEVEVTDETISMRGGSLSFGARKVRRGHIHFLRESGGSIFRERGLQLSERGPIHQFLFGYVWIPMSVPQYEEIKSKAISWMKIG